MRTNADIKDRQVYRLTLYAENPADVLFHTQVLWKLETNPGHAQAFVLRSLAAKCVKKKKKHQPKKKTLP